MGPGTRPTPGDADDPRSWPVKRAQSFGGVVVRPEGESVAVAMIRTRNLKDEQVWTLPKGTPDEGEAPQDTALREVHEETGLEVEVSGRAGDVEYWFVLDGVRHHKRVRFFLMRVTGGDPTAHDNEVEEVALVEGAQAAGMLSYQSERKVLSDALIKAAT